MKLFIIVTSALVSLQASATSVVTGDPGGITCSDADIPGLATCVAVAPVLLCAPDVQTNNIIKTQQTLEALANGELSNSAKFNSLVKEISAQPENKKMNAYMQLIGIKDDTALVEFVGGRTPDETYIRSLAKNASITDAQSRLVLERVAQSLLGEQR